VKLEPLPCWAHLPKKEYRARVATIVEEIEARAAAERQESGQPAKGPAAVRAQKRHDRPARLKKSPAPFFHAASRRVRRDLVEAYRRFVVAFREAAAQLRAGERDILFPPGSFPPAAPWVAG
jgi:hypothetical protein